MLEIILKQKKLLIFSLGLTFLSFIFFISRGLAVEYNLDNLDNVETWQINQDINDKRNQIQELKKQVELYQKNIATKQAEISNLSNQMSLLNENIAKINLEIKTAELEIETLNLKLENTELKIQSKEKEIATQKENVAEILRSLHRQQQQNSVLEILFLNNNFSEFVAELDRLDLVQQNVVKEVDGLQTVKMALLSDVDDLEKSKTEVDALKNLLDNKKDDLSEQKSAKSSLMKLTQGQEAKFQTMLSEAKKEQAQIDSDIVYLEKIAREKLNRQLQQQAGDSKGLIWPLASHRITAYFHDPDYPYRYIFEHPAIDIATAQGTAIKAVDSGYVAKTKDGGKTGYSYIMIVHADGLSSVYGHVNQISISEDQFVSKGQIIGYSGGMPGTRGAGPFSTGPHLHLEIRLNGVPVDPLNYLP